MTCQEAGERLLDEPQDGILRQHLESCASCRGLERAHLALRGIQAGRPPAPLKENVLALARRPARSLPWRAAAAVLLGALGLGIYLHGREPAPVPAQLPESGPPKGIEVSVSDTLGVIADQGTEAKRLSPDRLLLTRGRILVHASSPCVVATPFGECRADRAVFEASCRTSPAALLMSSAHADEGTDGELFVLKGSVMLGSVQVVAGQLLKVASGRPLVPEACNSRAAWWEGNAPWQEVWAGELRPDRRVERSLPPASRFVWTAVLKGPKGGYLDVSLPPGPWGEVMTLGELPQLADGREHALTLRWDLAPALMLDGVALKEFPFAAPAGGKLGLGVTAGVVQVKSWQWRPLP